MENILVQTQEIITDLKYKGSIFKQALLSAELIVKIELIALKSVDLLFQTFIYFKVFTPYCRLQLYCIIRRRLAIANVELS